MCTRAANADARWYLRAFEFSFGDRSRSVVISVLLLRYTTDEVDHDSITTQLVLICGRHRVRYRYRQAKEERVSTETRVDGKNECLEMILRLGIEDLSEDYIAIGSIGLPTVSTQTYLPTVFLLCPS